MTTFEVVGGRLLADGKPVRFEPSPNIGGECSPLFLTMHFTAGGYNGAVSWLCDPKARASAHLVISEEGDITQLVPFDRAAWHAGPSEWKGCTTMNTHSIGIELANYGELDGGPGRWSFAGRHVPDERVFVGRHKNGGAVTGWHTYPTRQVEVALAVAAALHRAFHFDDIVGHDDIAPKRKTDPGPAFDMAGFRSAVLTGSSSPAPVITPAPASPRRIVAVVSRRDVQVALNALGYGPIDEDGVIGDESRAAVKRFQSAAGLDDDGDPGPLTKKALEAALEARG